MTARRRCARAIFFIGAAFWCAVPALAQQPAPPDTGKEGHPQDTKPEAGFVISPDSGRTTLRIAGSIRLAGNYDFGSLAGRPDFSIVDISTSGEDNPQFLLEAYQTRFGFELKRPGTVYFSDVFARLEADFRGQNNALRLRHAYVTARRFLVGLSWTTFSHVATLPVTVDFEGPPTAVSLRSAQVRFTYPLREDLRVAIAAESPSADLPAAEQVSGGTVQSTAQDIPDFVARLRLTRPRGEWQIAGVGRHLQYRDSAGGQRGFPGVGLELSGRVRFGTLESEEVVLQAVYGSGIARYVSGLSGRGFDASVNPVTGELEPIPVQGGYVSYGHRWSPIVWSYLVAGLNRLDAPSYASGDAYRSSQYFAVNTFLDPHEGVSVGAEAVLGRRFNVDGTYGTAFRLQWIARFDF